ncbi:MAG: alanine racemase [Marinicellaceae bacterium]
MSRGTKAIINYNNLRHNFNVLSNLAPDKLILVVKADAYGHGLKRIVKALDDVDCFAVATIDEALIIRSIRPNVRILLLEGYLDKKELQAVFDNKFDSVIHQQYQLDLLRAASTDQKINIWLKLDTGMNRLGFNHNDFSLALKELESNKNTQEIVLMSHLASANLMESQFTNKQKSSFLKYAKGHQMSLSNSSALLNGNHLKQEWSRVGLALFGVSPVENTKADEFGLKPVMTVKSNVIAIKEVQSGESIGYSQTFFAQSDMKIAIIGIGYGDGYPWTLSTKAYVSYNNQKANIVGRVSMDMLAIDISHIQTIQIGDSVLVWGEDMNQQLPLETVATNAFTIPYVLLCQITSRVKYQYTNE